MPIYEYHCGSCSSDFEKLESISSSRQTECPKCGKAAERKISLTSYHLSGSGFHNTDYKKQEATCPSSGEKSACSGCPSAK